MKKYEKPAIYIMATESEVLQGSDLGPNANDPGNPDGLGGDGPGATDAINPDGNHYNSVWD